MIRAWVYSKGSPTGVEVEPDRFSVDQEALLWIDVANPSVDDIHLLTRQLGIHHLAGEDLLNPHQRTKLERYEDHFHVAMHDCRYEGEDFFDSEMDIVFGDGWLVTVHHQDPIHPAPDIVSAAQLLFSRQSQDHGALDEGFALWAMLDILVDRYFLVTDEIDDRLEALEDVVFETGFGDDIPADMYRLRRTLVGFRRSVGPLREVIAALLRREAEFVDDQAIVHLQDVYDHVLRVMDLIESQRDLLTGVLEAHLAVVSNRMNKVMKVTSSWGAILLVSTLIAGIYGMNFRHMPELAWQYGYAVSLGAMAAATALLFFVFRRKDWL